jgi:UDP-N-acetylglucosamine 1-carboxyvinyltransferase
MQSIVIEGGKRLKGEVKISGAKNAALPILCATILAPGENTITNVPVLKDVSTMGKLLEGLGAMVEHADGTYVIDTKNINKDEAPYDLVKTMRASVLVLGPLVARLGRAKVSLPGGCAIGERPINLHLMGLEKMGAKVEIEHGYVVATAKRLNGAKIYLDTPTVTGTENLMMAATLADGMTTLENAACEPEVTDLANYLNAMGARVRGAGTDTIRIEGVDSLKAAPYSVMPDRIETGTFLTAGAITGGEIMVATACPTFDPAPAEAEEAGLEIETGRD